MFNKIAHDALCIVTNNANPLAEPRPGAGPGDLRRQRPQLERASRAPPQTGTIDLFVRTAASGTQDAFQKIFMGTTNVFSRRQPEGLQRPGPAVGRRPTRTGSATSRCPSPRASHAVPYKGVACTLRNAKSGQYGGVRNFYMVTRGAPTRRREEVDQLDHRTARRRSKIIATAVGAAALVSVRPARAARSRRTAPTSAPSVALGALACAVLLLIARHDRLRLLEGLAVVRAQRPRLVRRRAATSTSS